MIKGSINHMNILNTNNNTQNNRASKYMKQKLRELKKHTNPHF